MRRFAVTALLVVVFAFAASLAGGRSRAVRVPSDAAGTQFGLPMQGLTAEQRDRFESGRTAFTLQHGGVDGLGPVFNGTDCLQCHHLGGIMVSLTPGGSSEFRVTRIGRRVNNVFDPMTEFGGPVLQNNGLNEFEVPNHPFRGERVPQGAVFVSPRTSQPLFGLGLVDATPDETFIALAQMQAINDPATAGHVNVVTNLAMNTKTVGKFGWKAQVPSLFQFSGDALVNELGVTSPLFPHENCPGGDCNELAFNPMPALNDTGDLLRRIADFMLMLGPPARGPITPDVQLGEMAFNEIGCGSCHVSTLTTGGNEIAALNHKNYHPYSDFLLHDMGSLGDGIENDAAKGNEFRTQPLWGSRARHSFLHDGRATKIEDAILAHDGQGSGARERFKALDPIARSNLVKFVKSL